MTPQKFFAVSGRFHGDDEAVTLCFSAASCEDPLKHFKTEMCVRRALTDLDRAVVMGDDAPEHMQIYVDTVLCSDSPIKVV